MLLLLLLFLLLLCFFFYFDYFAYAASASSTLCSRCCHVIRWQHWRMLIMRLRLPLGIYIAYPLQPLLLRSAPPQPDCLSDVGRIASKLKRP